MYLGVFIVQIICLKRLYWLWENVKINHNLILVKIRAEPLLGKINARQ